MKTLSEKELAKINENDLQLSIAQEKLKVCHLGIKNMELTMKILSLEIAAEKNRLESLRSNEANVKAIKQDALKIIQKKKGLKDGWGFNPDSGEIVES